MMAGLLGLDSAEDSEEVHHVSELYSPKFERFLCENCVLLWSNPLWARHQVEECTSGTRYDEHSRTIVQRDVKLRIRRQVVIGFLNVKLKTV
jgi:hypothetical protein